MRRLAALALCAATMIAPACQADTRDDVTALIRAGDQAAILSALSNPDRAEQRAAFGAFQTARADAGRVSAALLAAHPDDPRAMAARGWHLQAMGWAMRGQSFIRHTYPDALRQMDALHAEGFALAQAAVAADPALFPASDLLLSLARTTGHRDLIPDEMDRAMAVWPNRQTMILAIGGMTPNWGGPQGWGFAACARYAALIRDVPGYTAAVCEVDILFAAPYPATYQQGAYDLIPGLDHPILDDARFARAMSGMVPPAEAIAVLDTFLSTGKLGLTGADVLDNLRGQAMPIVGGPAVAQVLDSALDRVRGQIDFNPADSDALRRYIDALGIQTELRGTPFPRDELIARFAALFALAPYGGDTWARYGELMAAGLDWQDLNPDRAEAVRHIYQNGVYYTNHSPDNVRALDHFNRTVWNWFEQGPNRRFATDDTAAGRERFDRLVICPTVRSIRVLTAVCEGGPGRIACPRPDDPADEAHVLLTRAEERGACTAERTAPVESLAYDPAPADVPGGG
ncbi:MAG: hypothetical protein ACT4OK_21385 [Gemmobacter sp.]